MKGKLVRIGHMGFLTPFDMLIAVAALEMALAPVSYTHLDVYKRQLATLMDQLNYLMKLAPEDAGRCAFETYVVLLAPMAPHIAEELWRALGHTASVLSLIHI